jgi:hypothetical protein
MRSEAGVDEGVVHRLGIEDGKLPAAFLEREQLGGRVVRSRLAKGWVIPPAHRRGEPDAAFVVEHRVVIVGSGVPKLLVAVIG